MTEIESDEFTLEETDQGTRGAWALFIALEDGNYDLANELQAEFDRLLHAGWPLVANALRYAARRARPRL